MAKWLAYLLTDPMIVGSIPALDEASFLNYTSKHHLPTSSQWLIT